MATDSQYAGRVLAIDYGSKRIGIAMSDPTRMIAQGVGTFANDDLFLDKLRELVIDGAVAQIVIGMPYSEDGGKGKKALEVEEFLGELRKKVTVPIDTWDESLTSVTAKSEFIKIGMKKKKRQQKARVDEMAARLMLQEFLDSHSSTRES